MPYTVTVTLRRNETGEERTFDWWTYTVAYPDFLEESFTSQQDRK